MIVLIVMELIIITIIKRAISIYGMPNLSQVLLSAFYVGLLPNGYTEVGVKPPFYGRRAHNSSSSVGGRRRRTFLHGAEREELPRALGTNGGSYSPGRSGQGWSGAHKQRKNGVDRQLVVVTGFQGGPPAFRDLCPLPLTPFCCL